jgi:hypothetical protein
MDGVKNWANWTLPPTIVTFESLRALNMTRRISGNTKVKNVTLGVRTNRRTRPSNQSQASMRSERALMHDPRS